MATSKYIDIPLYLNGGVVIKDADVVVQRIRLLLQTEPGDFMDIPLYGTVIKPYLYEGITDDVGDLVKMSITHSLTTWMAEEVRVESINIETNPDDHSIAVNMQLYLLEFGVSVGVLETYKSAA